jgi:N-acetylmuramoyl-L-alanine amidase
MRWLIFTVMMALSNSAWGDFKPLTRTEPIVRMVLQEAANEPFAGMVAVAGVALDRIRDDRWPDTARDVVYSPAQFTGMGIALRRYSQAQIKKARIAVEIALSGTRPCGEVLWYHTTEVKPSWRERLTIKCQLGVHIFYGDNK